MSYIYVPVVTLWLISSIIAQTAPIILDRTDASKSTYLHRMPGATHFGSPDKRVADAALDLPLSLETESVIISSADLVATIKIENRSSKSVRVPTSLDQVKVYADGLIGRQQIAIELVLSREGRILDPPGRRAITVLFSADAYSDSYLDLAPGASFLLRVAARANSFDIRPGDAVYISAVTTKLSDTSFTEVSRSRVVTAPIPVRVAYQ